MIASRTNHRHDLLERTSEILDLRHSSIEPIMDTLNRRHFSCRGEITWTEYLYTYINDMSALTILMLSLDGSGSGFFGDLLFLKSRFAGSIALSYYSLVPPKPPR
ncbi:hypothetical protein TWF225_009204 [Orbilia oligospora]|nr:hypothetical protein TWF225_009204 [Orbilia oligospora]KAF3269826.1 hypothetical protein TWF217_008188 [Orbilia oligospora]